MQIFRDNNYSTNFCIPSPVNNTNGVLFTLINVTNSANQSPSQYHITQASQVVFQTLWNLSPFYYSSKELKSSSNKSEKIRKKAAQA